MLLRDSVIGIFHFYWIFGFWIYFAFYSSEQKASFKKGNHPLGQIKIRSWVFSTSLTPWHCCYNTGIDPYMYFWRTPLQRWSPIFIYILACSWCSYQALFKMGRGCFSVFLSDSVTGWTHQLLRWRIGVLALQIFPGDRAAQQVNPQYTQPNNQSFHHMTRVLIQYNSLMQNRFWICNVFIPTCHKFKYTQKRQALNKKHLTLLLMYAFVPKKKNYFKGNGWPTPIWNCSTKIKFILMSHY